jgi:DNA-binding Xre family transcriptional regulator
MRGIIMIIYERLWKKMQEQGVSQYRLHAEGISNSTLTRLRRNEPISTETIDRLCRILQCNVENIMEYKEDSNELS